MRRAASEERGVTPLRKALAGLGVAAAIIVVGCSSSPTHSTAGGRPHGSSTPSTSPSIAPSASPSSSPASSRAALEAWYKAGGGKALSNLTLTLQGAASQGKSLGLSGTLKACPAVTRAVAKAEHAGSAPYPRAEYWLSRAFGQFDIAVADCRVADKGANESALQRASAAISQGDRDLDKADALIASELGRD
jgi:hypothetical protein